MENSLKKFYINAAAAVRCDLDKQKMLLPPETMAELCSEHHRQHRNCAESLTSADGRSGKSAKKLICAIQKAFPEAGIVRQEYDFLSAAESYEQIGSSALAVFTEKHFYEGAPSMLTGITHLVKLPVIRWDFIIDEYQLMQSKLWGADAVRLLPALLDQADLTRFVNIAADLELEVIFEVADQADIERATAAERPPAGILINTEHTDNDKLIDLLQKIPPNIPALCAGDRYEITDLQQMPVDGIMFSRKFDSSPALQNFFK